MPKIPTRRDLEIEAALRERALFEDASTWQRSQRGNLWRHWEGLTLSVFRRKDGWFGWSIAGVDGCRFSSGRYEVEEWAISALGEELEVGR